MQDASLGELVERLVGESMVDAAVDAVGSEAKGHGHEAPATVLNSILNDRCQVAKAVNATVISLDESPHG